MKCCWLLGQMQTEYDGKILRNTVEEFREILRLFGQMQTAHIALQIGTNCQVCLWQFMLITMSVAMIQVFSSWWGNQLQSSTPSTWPTTGGNERVFFWLWPSFPWRRWQWSDGYDDGDFFSYENVCSIKMHTQLVCVWLAYGLIYVYAKSTN